MSQSAFPWTQGVGKVSNIPQWFKVGSGISYAALAAAALSNSIVLCNLPAGGIVHGIKLAHTAAFGGGGITGYTLSVGVSGALAKLASAFNVFQAPGATVLQLSSNFDEESQSLATQLLLTAVSIGANLNVATSGALNAWALLSVAS